ncbi:hypothetical protein V1515DRAFT_520405, partial [Lipomyces mesembrius]
VFESEADESPDWEAGDLYVKVQERYRRRGADTFRVEDLSSREGLRWNADCAFVDGSNIAISRKAGETVQTGEKQVVKGK